MQSTDMRQVGVPSFSLISLFQIFLLHYIMLERGYMLSTSVSPVGIIVKLFILKISIYYVIFCFRVVEDILAKFRVRMRLQLMCFGDQKNVQNAGGPSM